MKPSRKRAAVTAFDDMPNDLDMGDAPQPAAPVSETGRQRFVTQKQGPAEAAPGEYHERCQKCGGRGIRSGGYVNPWQGKCFACKGKGFFTFKTSPEVRAKAHQRAEKQRQAKEVARQEWRKAHATEIAWIERNSDRSTFAFSMGEKLAEYGTLTDNQVNAIRKSITQAAERAAQHAANAPTVDAKPMEAAFAAARAKGLKKLQMHVGAFKVKPAKETSANAGALYVTRDSDSTYLGKILGGKFMRSRDCSTEEERKVVETCADPLAALIAHGKETGYCGICNRELTDPVSIARGIGPICAEGYGL